MFYRLLIAWVVAVSGLLLSTAALAQAAKPLAGPGPVVVSNYKMAAGDVLTIKVFGEEDLSREKIRLTDAGTVFYPVLGEIQVLGKTVGELEKLITDGLRGRYLVNPRVAVTIDDYRQFFVNGQVEKAGAYPYQPGLTVAKAVAIAGGFKERASQSKMFVIRETDPKKGKERVELGTGIFPGDVLTVEESFF
jgi:protein involved in polysaccharide export with SLBB domain